MYVTLYQESNKNDIIPGIFLAEIFIPSRVKLNAPMNLQ
ncbi:hypothetical protein [Lysinibacillus parviboronicapiens]